MAGFRNPAIDGPVRCDFQRTGRSDIPNHLDFDSDQKENGDVKLPDTKTTRQGKDPRDARVLLSSPPKVGKTTLLSQWAPDTTLILDTHKGTALLDGEHYIAPVPSFAEFESAVDQLAGGNHQFRTVGIDLIEDVWKLADRHAGQNNGKVAAGLVEFGKGTAEAEGLFRRAVDKLLATDLGIWFITHVDTEQDGKGNAQSVPRLDKRIRSYIEGVTDFNLIGETTGRDRRLRTAPSAKFQTGARFPLPDPMPLDARALYVEIAKGLGKQPTAAPSTTSQEAIAA